MSEKNLKQSVLFHYPMLLALIIATALVMLEIKPIHQDLAYHHFADTRVIFTLPNGLNVLSNLAFLWVGFLGLQFGLTHPISPARIAWLVFFAGVFLVGFGSGYYHWQPNNASLVWDRLPMTVAFMALFIALLSEYISTKLLYGLVPAVLIGASSVFYWQATGDLRFYVWIQFMPLLVIPIVVWLFKNHYPYTLANWLLLALRDYALAKVAEFFDSGIYHLSHAWISGHTLKHLLAASACYNILLMLQKRQTID